MAKLIHEHTRRVQSPEGAQYRALVFGEERTDGTWMAWLEFEPVDRSGGRRLRTGQETSQPDERAAEYWAGGLEPIYLEGALTRARELVWRIARGSGETRC